MTKLLESIRGYLRPIDTEANGGSSDCGAGLRPVLGRIDLILMGVGVIIGGGILVVTGTAAAQYAGPSAYTYTYAALGETLAWIIGWNLILEYIFAAAYVTVGWSGYCASLLAGWGIVLPRSLISAPLQIVDGKLASSGGLLNLPAVLLAIAMALVAIRGVRLSSFVNGAIVALKVGALLLVIAFGSRYVHVSNWSPFLPPNDGTFGHYGWSGVLRGASVVFVSYLGFDAVATMAQDTRHPQRDLPAGILGSLAVVSLIYVSVALVLTGLVSYTRLDAPNPLSVALGAAGPALKWLVPVVDVAAVVGLSSVVLVIMLAQPRVVLAMGRDGLLPAVFARVSERYGTPSWGTAACGIAVALLAGLFPLSVLIQLVSVGTLCVFIVVSLGVIVLRHTDPGRHRPFRAPMVPLLPSTGMLLCGYLLIGIPAVTWRLYCIWLALGLCLYTLYGRRSAAAKRVAGL